MHYTNLNGCNSRMLWNIYPCFKENNKQILTEVKALQKIKV